MKKKSLVLGVAGALAVAGGGVGIAATRADSNESQAVIDDAAKRLGVEPAALSNALKSALKDRIDAAVAAGRLTKAQGDALKARIDAGGPPILFGGLARGPFGHLLKLDAAASYLGLTEAQVETQVAGRKTLAQIAKERGKSVDGLVDAMTAEVKSRLDAAVAAGKLTRAQADQALKDVKQRVTDRVNGEGPSLRGLRGFRAFPGYRDFHRPDGFRRFRGPTF
jgi:uncharacterized protein YidB (DUF937 family)